MECVCRIMIRIPISSVLLLSLSLLREVSLVPLNAMGNTEADNTRESYTNKSEVDKLSTHEKQLIQMSPLYSIFNVFPSMQPDEDYEDEPSCGCDCPELDPETVHIGCPPLQRGLRCGNYSVYHYHRKCLVATVYCHRNSTNSEVGIYVAGTGTDIDRNSTGLFVLPYIDEKEGYVPPLVLEKPYQAGTSKGELVCGANGKWILYDTHYRYEVDHLFCLVSEATNLNYLMDLSFAGPERSTPKPFRRGDRNFFEPFRIAG